MAHLSSFEWLISPTSVQEFFDQHWEAKFLVQERGSARYYSELISMQVVDDVISRHRLRFSELIVFATGQEIKSSDYVRADGTIDVKRVFALFAGGATIGLKRVDRKVPALTKLCAKLGAEQSIRFHTNAYLTPANSGGFSAHYDTHDVYLLQIEGKKRWKIFGSVEELPLRAQTFTPPGNPGPVVHECELTPGDLIYLPRGTYHQGQSGSQASLHLTLGALAYTWTDLILEAIAATSLSETSLRRALPIGFARTGFNKADFESLFKGLVEEFSANADFDKALSGIKSGLDDFYQPTLEGRLALAAQLGDATQDQTLRMRRDVSVKVHDVNGDISIDFLSRRVVLPGAAKEIVQFIVEQEEFSASQLPGGLDIESKMAVIRRMILEGLLELAEPSR